MDDYWGDDLSSPQLLHNPTEVISLIAGGHRKVETVFRAATVDDATQIAVLNRDLIRDEGHRNPMNLLELSDRMMGWLQRDYEAVVFCQENELIGYALFRREPDHVYLRQFYVTSQNRRKGIGRQALRWMRDNVWVNTSRLRLDVLVGNTDGLAFWRAVGFTDYCLTMEADLTCQ